MKTRLTKMSCTITIGAVAFLAAGQIAHAQQTHPQQSPNQTAGTMQQSVPAAKQVSDETFARKAAEGGLAEVELGQLAEEKGQSQAVKDFGQRMVTDHSKANDELKNAAAQENIKLPDKLNAKEQAIYDGLSKLSGSAFDKAYAHNMVKDHRIDLREFNTEAQNGQDEPIKNFAAQTVPTLQEHLKMANHMLNVVSGASSGQSGSGSSR